MRSKGTIRCEYTVYGNALVLGKQPKVVFKISVDGPDRFYTKQWTWDVNDAASTSFIKGMIKAWKTVRYEVVLSASLKQLVKDGRTCDLR